MKNMNMEKCKSGKKGWSKGQSLKSKISQRIFHKEKQMIEKKNETNNKSKKGKWENRKK